MVPILAQNNAGAGLAGVAAILLLFVCGILIVALVIGILFLLTLHRALDRCSPRNRTMEPGMVWLNLIPLFSMVWCFITVTRISESLEREFRSRGLRRQGDYGYAVGMTYCGINVASMILNFISKVEPLIGLLGLPLAIIGLICFIIYWVKIANYSSRIAGPRRRRRRDDDYDDDDEDDDEDEDDRPRRRTRDDDDDDDDYRPRNSRDRW